jgi:putative ABC transport system permease protein
MSGFAVAGRLARREVVRRPWRSLVVALLVVVPAALLTAVVVTARTADLTWAEQWDERHGTEDAVVEVGGTTDALGAQIPSGTELLEVRSWDTRVRTTDRARMWATVTDRDLDHPVSAGLVRHLDGRTPREPGEALLTRRLARHLGVGVGDILQLDRPGDATFTVVGVAEWGGRLDTHVLVLGGGGSRDVVAELIGEPVPASWLVDLPDHLAEDRTLLAELGVAPGSARTMPFWDQAPGSAGQAAVLWTWVGAAVAFTILGVVISAAFAVTARRQLRLLGQLMGNGASEGTLTATLFLQGTVVGLVGSVTGVAAGLIGLGLLRGVLEEAIGRRLGSFTVRPGDLVPIVVIATIAATVAALVPARTAVRTSALEALAGRRPLGPYPRRLVVRGAVAAGIGLFLLSLATAGAAQVGSDGDLAIFVLAGIAGSVVIILGTCAMAPALVSGLGPLASSLRGTSRLATRSIARQRTRTGAVVAAIAVVAAGAVAATSAWLTAEARDISRMPQIPGDLVSITYAVGPDLGPESTTPPQGLIDDVLAVVPDGHLLVTEYAHPPRVKGDYAGTTFLVVDDAVAEALGLSERVRNELDSGRAVPAGALEWFLGDDAAGSAAERAEMTIFDARGSNVGSLPLTSIDSSRVWAPSYNPLISPTTADDLGLERSNGPTLVSAGGALSGDQRDRLADIADDAYADHVLDPTGSGSPTFGWVSIQHPPESYQPSSTTVAAVLLAVATVATLAVVGLGLSLSAAETRDERDVLAAVGAPPRSLRRLAAAKAVALAVSGTVVGIPLGFIPTALVVKVAFAGQHRPLAAVFPWAQVGMLLVIVPVVAAVATLVASAVALRFRPVTASSMSFD